MADEIKIEKLVKKELIKDSTQTNIAIARKIINENDIDVTIESLRKKVALYRNQGNWNKTLAKEKENLAVSRQFEDKGESAVLTEKTKKRIKTLKDLIKVCEIDTNEWEIERWICNKWEVGSKSGNGMQIEELYQVKVWLKKDVVKINYEEIKQEIKSELKKHAYKYKPLKYKKLRSGNLLEVSLFDVHFGKLCWSLETGADYDIKIAQKLFRECVIELLNQAKYYQIDKILFIVGNDIFNVNNKNNTTVNGTPQDEDDRWKKTFKNVRSLIVDVIEKLLMPIAPVEVMVVPSNHDEERSFYLGDALECWFHKCKNVNVDNSPNNRKYFKYGNNLIGFTHGDNEKIKDLPTIMAIENKCFSLCRYREWHIGHLHHLKKIQTVSIDENQGVTTRILRSISAADAWHHAKGYVGSIRAGEAFIWNDEKGNIAHFTSSIEQ